ncbi:MAG: response regulator transcription factor, partial [Planctomycetota bacterium JB042]
LEAIRRVAAGRVFFSDEVAGRIIAGPDGVGLGATKTRTGSLTARELEVLRYLAQGLSKKKIAEMLGRSLKTIEGHVQNLMAKLDIHDRVELARYAIREGLVEA